MLESGFYNMDCMEGMKEFADNYFDLAVVDPPYGIGDINRMSRGYDYSKHKKIEWNDNAPDENYFNELYRISKNQVIWGVNYYSTLGFIKHSGRIVHYKQLTPWSKGKNLSECDLASQSFSNKIEYFSYQWSGNVQNGRINWDNNGTDGRIHPTQKPVALYRWILQKYAKPGDKILDTHFGSGSSLIACEREGFDYVGFEIDKDYYEAAVERMERERLQLKLAI